MPGQATSPASCKRPWSGIQLCSVDHSREVFIEALHQGLHVPAVGGAEFHSKLVYSMGTRMYSMGTCTHVEPMR